MKPSHESSSEPQGIIPNSDDDPENLDKYKGVGGWLLFLCVVLVRPIGFIISLIGLAIIEGLRGHTTGYGIPQLVIDAPGGGGKVPPP